MTKRVFDIVLALLAGVILLLPMAILALAVRLTSPGPSIYWSQRVGVDGKLFAMPKFRSMRADTPTLATHLLTQPDQFLTPIGRALRSTSLDELPQLWPILKGEMSFVGPRPALFNQDDLIAGRRAAGVLGLRPGLTGWAQINGRDEISIADKVALDAEYARRRSLAFDVKILMMTAAKVLERSNVAH
ncbi:MAG: sugar transferase [Erythrobacter sp.]